MGWRKILIILALVRFKRAPVFLTLRAVETLDLRVGRISLMEPKSPRRTLVALIRSDFKLILKMFINRFKFKSVEKLYKSTAAYDKTG